MEIKICVLAKHDGCDKEYVFLVPGGMTVRKGDILLVETQYGHKIATATSEVFAGKEIEVIAKKFGASLPLKSVLQNAGQEIYEYIAHKAYEDVVTFIERDLLHTLPF